MKYWASQVANVLMDNELIDSKEAFKKICPIKNIETLFSDRVGIINAILKRNELQRFGFTMFQSLTTKTEIIFENDRGVSSGGLGIHKNSEHALLACIGESLERYCMSYCPDEEIFFCKKGELPKNKVAGRHHLYSKSQYKRNSIFIDPDSDTEIAWTMLRGWRSDEELYWPASLVYLPFSKGDLVAETSSTGVAAGSSKEDAMTGGLLELIERDALMINYLQRLNPPEIDILSVGGGNKEMIERILEEYKIKLYKLYTDIDVPVYAAIIWTGEGADVHYGIGASAALSSEVAIEKALKECLFTYFYSKDILDLKVDNPNNIKTLYEHFLFYQGERFSELLFSSKIIKYERKEINKENLIEEMTKKFGNIFYKSLTTSDIKDSGIVVLKVVVPGLIDLNKSYALRREAAHRFKSVPRQLGLKTKNTLSPLPHPFP